MEERARAVSFSRDAWIDPERIIVEGGERGEDVLRRGGEDPANVALVDTAGAAEEVLWGQWLDGTGAEVARRGLGLRVAHQKFLSYHPRGATPRLLGIERLSKISGKRCSSSPELGDRCFTDYSYVHKLRVVHKIAQPQDLLRVESANRATRGIPLA